MSEAIRRAAAAVSASTGCFTFPCRKCETKEGCVSVVRVVMEAMRDPPENIISALQQWGVCAGDIDKGWNAAIDAMLCD